jgi:hypothetical protein
MPSLPELQARFAAALEADDDLLPRGFGVYRHAIDANYRRALAASFPVVCALVGRTFFDAAVDSFVAAHPPASGDLNIYGEAMAAFLEAYQPAASLPYIADVARLEWALDECARAPDSVADPLELIAAIGMVAEDEVPHIRLALHPSVRLVASAHPVFEIWQVHQPGHGDDMRVDFDSPRGARLLVRREGERSVIESIGAGELAWLQALANDSSFGDALARALEADTAFDLGEALERRVRDGAIAAVRSAQSSVM